MSDAPEIADHGLIGDLRTAALVATDGTIDWFCAPRFDSPSVFGAVLDQEKGGHWRIAPAEAKAIQFYFPDTNVLITRFLSADGVVELQDFMPVRRAGDAEHRERLVRRVTCVRGRMDLDMEVAPRFDYGRAEHEGTDDGDGIRFACSDIALELGASVDLELVDGRDARASFSLAEGDEEIFVLEVLEPDEEPAGHDPGTADDLFAATVDFWRNWLSQSTYTGRWREMVHRSALTLKLLCHEPSGAVVAAPTTSLPERVGGERNWDYRYVWIRDAAFSLYALLRLGFTKEAEAFMGWLTDRFREAGDGDDGPLRVMYTIDGDSDLAEEELDHLTGHRDSTPVRVGNAAVDQLQLDIYGEIVDSVYLFNKYGPGISADTWDDMTRIVDWLADNWDQPDEGVWEPRAGRQDHTFSRLMCWVAVERMVRMARQRGLPGDLDRWTKLRDEIYRQIMDKGWNEERGAYVRAYGDDSLDASLLLMPMVKFAAPTDPRFISTLDAIGRDLVADSLVFRYDPELADDGLDGAEGTFSICSFWYVEALTRAGRLEDARLALEKMFTYANHLGLYAEQVGVAGDQLGNFPQAFTHLALISAAINLDRELG